MTKKLSQEDAERRIKSISNINFIRWDSEYSGVKTKVVMKCSIDGFEWLVTANNLIHNNRGCPQCSGKRRWTAIEMVNQINDGGVVRFERWLDGYSGTKSRAVVSCVKCDYEYDVLITSIIHKRSGCPSCAKYGFDGSICGYVYFLVSRCGSFVKAGITNNINDRISYLRLKTPFDFDVVEYAHFSKGSDALALESKLHKIMNSAGLSVFNGCTEWFLFDDYASSAPGEIRKINGA